MKTLGCQALISTTNLIKKQFTVYADLESLIEKTDGNKNNPNNSSKTKSSKHILSSFSMSAISAFKSMEKKSMFTEVKIA